MRIKFLYLFILTLLLGACSVPKDVLYFQGLDEMTPEQINQVGQSYLVKIRPDDLLSISVTSSDPTVVTPFNPPTFAYHQEGEQAVFASQSLYTYLVNKDGEINFPVLGKVSVADLTRQELSEKLEKEISYYIKDPLVNVQIMNFKVTILGDVNRPGSISVKNDRLSILDALGQAGDLSINANRKNILIIRDTHERKEFGYIDITDPALFTSPYYYLQQNDIVYVEPNKAKQRNSRYSQAQQYNITVFSSVMSAVSVITAMVISIVNASN
ncbi:MAG: polysaccharide biosynthesis/export family protein [Tannerellaceae bacterium]|nr:polysaccharide biosynthesis/export family protein [Tannerellaceae bacterium]